MKFMDAIRIATVGSLSLTLLVACADGRGTNGFKSFRASPEQIARWKAENGGTDADAKRALEQAELNKPAVDTDGNQPSVLNEPTDSARSQILKEAQTLEIDPKLADQLKIANKKDLIVSNDGILKEEQADETASKIVKEISIEVNGTEQERRLTIDARVMITGVEHILSVKEAKLAVTQEGSVVSLPTVLRNAQTGAEVLAKSKVHTIGTCTEDKCENIQVRMEFSTKNDMKIVALFLIQKRGNEFVITQSNLSNIKPFAAIEVAKEDPAQTPAPATEQGQAPAMTAPESQTETTAPVNMRVGTAKSAKAQFEDALAANSQGKTAVTTLPRSRASQYHQAMGAPSKASFAQAIAESQKQKALAAAKAATATTALQSK